MLGFTVNGVYSFCLEYMFSGSSLVMISGYLSQKNEDLHSAISVQNHVCQDVLGIIVGMPDPPGQ